MAPTKRKAPSVKGGKKMKLTKKNIKKQQEDWSDESVNGDPQSSSGSEESGSDNDYNPQRDEDIFSDDQMLSDSDNEEVASVESVSEEEPESSADEEEIVSSSTSESGEDEDESSSEEEEQLIPLTTADLDEKINFTLPSLSGAEGVEVNSAIERSVAAALKIAENLHENMVESVQAVILEDDNADYVPEEFISYAGPKRKSARLRNVQKQPAIIDYESDEDEVRELMKIEKEVERNQREAEKLKKQNSRKKKSTTKKTKKKKVKKQASSDEDYDFEESVPESSGSEFEP